MKFNIGDKVYTLPGFTNNLNDFQDGTNKYGGAGYKEDLILTVSHVSNKTLKNDNDAYFFEELNGYGIYEYALENYSMIRNKKIDEILE